MSRVYLDHNATSPLTPAARAAMAAAMDMVGNPSSVHAEGRAAKALLEKSREQVSAALGATGADIVFTSGATESAALALAGRGLHGSDVEHEAIRAWVANDLPVDGKGRVTVANPAQSVLQLANSETGVVQDLPEALAFSDLTQGVGRIPFAWNWSGIRMAATSAHKIGGPRGTGVLILPEGTELAAQLRGGGQEMGRRSGTENLIGVVGMAAALTEAQARLAAGDWDRVAALRDRIEAEMLDAAQGTVVLGAGARRLPNTSAIATPGWKGETQVMAMDLAGFAVSAGSACSSGKVRKSRVAEAMGLGGDLNGSILRISLGLDTTEPEALSFVAAWTAAYRKMRARAA